MQNQNEHLVWKHPPQTCTTACFLCGNSINNQLILSAQHWHHDYGLLDVATCGACKSAWFVDAMTQNAPYPSTDVVLQDPNFIYLIYHYIEIVSGLDWKVSLLERLPFENFKQVLEVGCNTGVMLDYCRTVWQTDKVVGLEPSAYGVIMLTTPRAGALTPATPIGELYAALSPGAHYFLLSPEKLRDLIKQAGFNWCHIEAFGMTNVAFIAQQPIKLKGLVAAQERLQTYYQQKCAEETSPDARIHLSHLINHYMQCAQQNTPVSPEQSAQIEALLASQFAIDLAQPQALVQAVLQADSLVELGKYMPYGLPFFLYWQYMNATSAEAAPYPHGLALARLLVLQGLNVDFQNLFVYHSLLERIEKALHKESSSGHALSAELQSQADAVREHVAELATAKAPTPTQRGRLWQRLWHKWGKWR